MYCIYIYNHDSVCWLQVTLCSNTVQQYSLAMVVDVNGVGEELLALPIKARYDIYDDTL